MDNSIYIGISRQQALKDQMSLVANNIANMSTPGYRAQHALFQEYVEQQGRVAEVDDPISMVINAGQFDDTSAGPIQNTGNQLDIALNGPGFLGVVTPSGIEYTRGGNLSLDAQGQLITAAGFPVASLGGAPITIPEGSTDIVISENGEISNQDGALGSLKIAEFENYQSMTPQGNGLYATNDPEQPATNTRVLQGAIEGSNVNAVFEMTRMIEISRNYQSTQRLLQGEHDRQRETIQKLSRVS